jgi:alpha-tubulin suppressor-like RCC1 family protein
LFVLAVQYIFIELTADRIQDGAASYTMSASEKKRKISQENGNDFQSQEYPLSDRKSVAPRKVPKRRGEESSFQISQRDHWNYLVQKTFQLYESELTERNGGKFHPSIAIEIRRVLEEIKSKYCPTIGDVFVTGSNDGCQLGGAVSVSVSRLTLFKQLVDARIVHVTCGSMSNFILDQQGRVYSWGSSDKGALGRRTDTEADPDTEFKAIQITGFMPSRMAPAFRMIANDDKSTNNDENDDTNILQVVAGGSHVLFLSNHGSVYVAGSYVMDNKSWREEAPPDQPDQDYTDTELYEGAAPRGFRDQPRHVYRLPQLVDKIFAGTSMSAARLVDGTLMTWGSDAKGELGRGSTEENCEIVLNPKDKNEKKRAFEIMKHDFLVPKPVKYSPAIGKHIVLDVACGQNHMLVVLREEDSFETKVYGTGLNQYGQLGLGDATNRNVLTLVSIFTKHVLSTLILSSIVHSII